MGQPLNIVVLLADPPGKYCAKSYYSGAYTPDSDDPPDCSSSDGIRPDTFVDEPQCANCATCPMNQWGSGMDSHGNPTKGKACHDVKRLYVVPPNNPGKGDVFMLQVPTMSLKALTSYGRALKSHGVPVQACITKVSFVEDAEFPQIKFSLGGFMPEAETGAAVARASSEEIQSIIQNAAAGPVEETADVPDVPDYVKALETPDPDPEQTNTLARAGVYGDPRGAAESGYGGIVEQKAGPEVDSNGEIWDAARHSANKTLTANGAWRARKGNKQADAASPRVAAQPAAAGSGFVESEPEATVAKNPDGPAGSGYFQQPSDPHGTDLNSILEQWG
jgi:hypothetical protein